MLPSASLGEGSLGLYEPIHGSAPDIAGKGIANPVGALLSSVLMLERLGEPQAAERLRQAVLETLASGLRTADLGGTAGTTQFTRAVCEHLR
jgi:isocitrate/isopropylmalate dehydrogenase